MGDSLDGSDFVARVSETTKTGDQTTITVTGPESTETGNVTLTIDGDGALQTLSNQSKAIFESAADKIEAAYFANAGEGSDSLPEVDSIQSILGDLRDAHGNPILYKLQSRDQYQLVSEGADKIDGTKWDETLTGVLNRARDEGDTSESTFNWLERRQIEIKGEGDSAKIAAIKSEIEEARGGGAETTFSRDFNIGGRVLLEGADYFWFWTKCIAITAILFVPVGYFYREKTYIQDSE